MNTVVDSASVTAARGSPAVDPGLEAPVADLIEPAAADLDAAAADLDAAAADLDAAAAALDAAAAGLGAANGEYTGLDGGLDLSDGEPVEDSAAVEDLGAADDSTAVAAGPDTAADQVADAEVADSAPDVATSNGIAPDIAAREDSASQEDAADPEPESALEEADVQGNSGKCANLGANGEPPGGDGRLTGVTATLSESAILPDLAPADEALAPPDSFATSAFEAEERRKPAVWAAADVVTEIYHGHYKQLVRLAVLLVHDVQTAEEVVQDAFEAMHLASRRLRDSEKALQYLRQTVVNRSRSVLRHRKVVDMHAPKPAPDEPSAEHAALAILERSAVAAALRSLPERQREAIALRYYADFSEADIAKAMGISKGAVKSHTARAMASLKTILSQESS